MISVKISEKNALIKSNELSELLALFIETGENLFLKNLKLTGEKQIDRRMWVVFKQDIEKRMKIEILKDFQELFESKIAFINKMLKNLNEVFFLNFFYLFF